MCQCMPVKMVSLICRPLCHMPSVVWETSCDIGMKYPPFLQDKPPPPPPPAFPSFSVLYFCNWRCHNAINSVGDNRFHNHVPVLLWKRPPQRGKYLKICLFHASSISSFHERWASHCIYYLSHNAT